MSFTQTSVNAALHACAALAQQDPDGTYTFSDQLAYRRALRAVVEAGGDDVRPTPTGGLSFTPGGGVPIAGTSSGAGWVNLTPVIGHLDAKGVTEALKADLRAALLGEDDDLAGKSEWFKKGHAAGKAGKPIGSAGGPGVPHSPKDSQELNAGWVAGFRSANGGKSPWGESRSGWDGFQDNAEFLAALKKHYGDDPTSDTSHPGITQYTVGAGTGVAGWWDDEQGYGEVRRSSRTAANEADARRVGYEPGPEDILTPEQATKMGAAKLPPGARVTAIEHWKTQPPNGSVYTVTVTDSRGKGHDGTMTTNVRTGAVFFDLDMPTLTSKGWVEAKSKELSARHDAATRQVDVMALEKWKALYPGAEFSGPARGNPLVYARAADRSTLAVYDSKTQEGQLPAAGATPGKRSKLAANADAAWAALRRDKAAAKGEATVDAEPEDATGLGAFAAWLGSNAYDSDLTVKAAEADGETTYFVFNQQGGCCGYWSQQAGAHYNDDLEAGFEAELEGAELRDSGVDDLLAALAGA
jgi:hypothetical protein